MSTNVKCTLTSRGLTSLLKKQRPCTIRRMSPSRRSSTRKKTLTSRLPHRPTWVWVHHVIEQRTVTRTTFQAFINELMVILAPRVPIYEEVFIIFDGARPHLNIVVPPEFEDTGVRFHVVDILPIFQPRRASPQLLEECDQATFWCFLTFKLKFSIFKTCGWRLISISSSGEPTCCFELGTTHFSKLHNRNVQTGARVFIGISLHLSIEKSFTIKSNFINVNKYIVIVNEHSII